MADEHKNTKKQDTAAATAAAREAAARAAGHVNPAVEALLEQTAKKSDRNNDRGKHPRSDQTAKSEATDKADLPTASDTKPADKTEEQTAAEQTAPKAENDLIDAIVDKIDATDDILVTLSRDPSIDEMAAAIGLTLFLDRLDKHATAIYSGRTPKILEFLHPDKTFEKNTDSLRDFIVALSKDKADHLRYKLDGDFVKIYITPYKTTITPEDLDFSYGNYNVDLVLALDVPEEGKLDNALKEFGKITEGAEIIDITTGAPGKVGQLEWSNPNASSISELVAKLVIALEDDEITMNAEEATAFLTGIVAETERFSNAKTTADVMSLAADLMDRGADQQLIPRDLRPESEPRPDADTKEETPNRDAAEVSDQGKTEITPPVEPPVESPVAPEPENKSVEAEGKLAINSRRRRNVATIAPTPAAPETIASETEPETPEPTTTLAPEAIAAEAAPAPVAEPATEPIGVPEPAAVPEPVTATVPESIATTVPEPVTATVPVAVPEPKPAPVTEPTAKVEPEPTAAEAPAPQLMGAVDLPDADLNENAHLSGSVTIEPTEEAKPKDYGAMMAAALAEPVPGMPNFAAPAAAPATVPAPAAAPATAPAPVAEPAPVTEPTSTAAPVATTPAMPAPVPNPAALAAPTVSEQPELNGVPAINYGEPVAQPEPIDLPPPPAPPVDPNALLPNAPIPTDTTDAALQNQVMQNLGLQAPATEAVDPNQMATANVMAPDPAASMPSVPNQAVPAPSAPSQMAPAPATPNQMAPAQPAYPTPPAAQPAAPANPDPGAFQIPGA